MEAINPTYLRTSIISFFQTLAFINNTYQAWDSRTFDFATRSNVEGYLTINQPHITVEVGPYQPFTFATVSKQENEDLLACVQNMTFPQFNTTFDYIADIGVNNEHPIYGNGRVNSRLSDVETTFCWLLEATGAEIKSFDINVTFRHAPSSLTGFYRNEDLNPIIENLFTLVKRILAMWNNYEPECMRDCLWNPIFYYMTNLLIHGVDKIDEISFDACTCLKDVYFYAMELFLIDDEFNDLSKKMSALLGSDEFDAILFGISKNILYQ